MSQQTASPSKRTAREITALLILTEEFSSHFFANNDTFFYCALSLTCPMMTVSNGKFLRDT